jgi:hypothetical protein
MVKRKALMESISSNLHGFLKKTGKNFITAGQTGLSYVPTVNGSN